MISIGFLPGMPFLPFFVIGMLIGSGGVWSIKIQEAEELKIQEWMKDSAEVNLDNRDGKFLFYLAVLQSNLAGLNFNSDAFRKSLFLFNQFPFYL